MHHSLVPLAAVILALAHVHGASAAGRDVPSCYSNTGAYLVKSLTVATQPLRASLIQRYQGNQLTIDCMSFVEYGPSCGSSSVPQLCYRAAADASASFTCETLTEYVDNPDAQIVRGSQDGPEMIWLVKWDGTSKSVSCYPRQVDIRMLAFIENGVESSDTVFALLLIVSILSVLLIVVALYSYIRTRYYQLDSTGATSIAGPKTVFRGPQMAVQAPTAYAKDITTVYLPVRDSAALNDMTTSKVGQLLSDPNTPRGRRAIYLDDDGADGSQFPRGPGNSSIRRRKASPPAPGDGIHDPVLAQKMMEGRQMRTRLRRHGKRSDGGDDDDDALFDDEDRFNARMRGQDDYEDNLEGSSRRGGPGSSRRGGPGSQQRPRRGMLFPTQANFTVAGEDTANDLLMQQQYGSTRGLDFNDDDFDPEKPEMLPPKGNLNGSQHTIRYVPQWMQGSFGRGGVIPEAGDGPDNEYEGGDLDGQPRAIHLDSFNGSGAPGSIAKRYYEPVAAVDQENVSGSMPLRGGKVATPNNSARYPGGVDSQPRSALKRRGGNAPSQMGDDPFGDGPSDDLLRRGVSFEGDYAGRRTPAGGAAGRSFGGLPGGGGKLNDQQDHFTRNKAKIHNRAMQLAPDAAQEEGARSNANHQHSGSNDRMAVVGMDERGNAIYSNNGTRQANAAGGTGVGAYECEDCHERVHPGSHPFCDATGLRHF